MSATPAWAASIANSSCSPDGPGSGTWSNVAGCWANAGAANSAHNLGETVIGSYGYVPTNVSFGTIFGFAGQSNAMYGTSLGANGVVSSGAQNSVALGAGSTALTMIPDVDQGKTVAVGVGAGTYQGYQAAALGASARVTENIKVKLGAGISAQGTTVGVGAAYQW